MTHTTKVTEMKATQKGALNGFKAECTCGFTATNTVKFNAQMDAHEHMKYMEVKENEKVNTNNCGDCGMPCQMVAGKFGLETECCQARSMEDFTGSERI